MKEVPVRYTWQVRMWSASHLDCWIKERFGGLCISHNEDGTTIIAGELDDLSAVYGFILQMRDAGINLLSLCVRRKRDTS